MGSFEQDLGREPAIVSVKCLWGICRLFMRGYPTLLRPGCRGYPPPHSSRTYEKNVLTHLLPWLVKYQLTNLQLTHCCWIAVGVDLLLSTFRG